MERPVREDDGVVTCFRDGRVTLRSRRRTTGYTESLKEIGYQGIRRGDLVIHAMDAFAGAVGVAEDDGKSTPVYAACVPRSDVSPRYYAHLIRRLALTGWIQANARGVRERSTDYRWASFAEERLPVPPPQDQEAIVTYLAHANQRINRAIRTKRRLIGLLRERQQAVIVELVLRGTNASAPLVDTGNRFIGKIPEGWAIRRFSQVVTPVQRIGHADEDLLSVYLGRGVIRYAEGGKRVHAPSLDLSAYQLVKPGDLVMNNQQAWRGSVGVSSRRGIVSPAYVVGELTQAIDPDYARYLLAARPMIDQYVVASKGVGDIQRSIYWPYLKTSVVPIPPVDEQREIAGRIDSEVSATSEPIRRIEREIDLLVEFGDRLTADVVTGQVDVRSIAARLPPIDLTDMFAASVGANQAEDDEPTDETFMEDG
ncbi:restriction endonuclease subunit S [Georgenia faecalis]|uniref:Restriction endonuclease subunit S n=1 Tax=Georgenia faecalis TaxID=2483799 RepID=A0ABV9DBX7_9MICO|nr:restriction endonuclease subunit S [Georgenia faecalis]